MQFLAVLNIFIVKTKLNSTFTNDLKRKYFFSKNVHSYRVCSFNATIGKKVVCFSRLLKCLRSLYGKQCGPRSDSGSTLFVSILNSSVMLGNYLQQTTFSDAFFSWRFNRVQSVKVFTDFKRKLRQDR